MRKRHKRLTTRLLPVTVETTANEYGRSAIKKSRQERVSQGCAPGGTIRKSKSKVGEVGFLQDVLNGSNSKVLDDQPIAAFPLQPRLYEMFAQGTL